jgi:hypothetical protein
VCFGCAATCAVQQLTGINLTPGNLGVEALHYAGDNTLQVVRANTLQVNRYDLSDFENTIDSFRAGYIGDLFNYMNVPPPKGLTARTYAFLPLLKDNNYLSNLWPYRVLLRYLKRYDI